MPTSFIRADQHMLRISVDGGSEGIDTQDFTQAQLVAECAAGPLKELFANPLAEPPPGAGSTSWDGLITDARLSVHITPVASGVASYRFVAGTPNVFRVKVNGVMIVELRYNHTSVR